MKGGDLSSASMTPFMHLILRVPTRRRVAREIMEAVKVRSASQYNGIQMAASSFTVNCHTEIEEQEPTGSVCAGCGDACYLRQYEIVLVITSPTPKSKHPSGVFMCESCRDAVDSGGPGQE